MVNNAPQSVLFNQSGEHGDRWVLGQADFSSRFPSFLLFDGVRGTSFDGDIALDDISVTMGTCASQPAGGSSTNAPITTAGKL